MTKNAGKGSLLQVEIASVFTTIPQLTSIDGPDMKPETYESRTLDDGAGIGQKPTGYVAGGTVSFEGFLDPVGAAHQALTDLITAPALVNWKLKFSDAASTVWPFSGTLTNFKTSIKMNDGIKFNGEITLDGIPTLPT